MDSSSQEVEKKKINEVTTFAVPFALEEIKENITLTTNASSKPSKENGTENVFTSLIFFFFSPS